MQWQPLSPLNLYSQNFVSLEKNVSLKYKTECAEITFVLIEIDYWLQLLQKLCSK